MIVFDSYGNVTIDSEGLQNLALQTALKAFEQGDLYLATPAVTLGLSFCVCPI
jgi:hypothetical protein